jgi:hypothetical protein
MHTHQQFVKTILTLLVVNKCILDQTQGYWLVSNVLNVDYYMSVCMQNEICQFEININ